MSCSDSFLYLVCFNLVISLRAVAKSPPQPVQKLGIAIDGGWSSILFIYPKVVAAKWAKSILNPYILKSLGSFWI